MRILFLCQYFPPEMGAPAARTFEHARRWVESGHSVTVVCGFPNHPDGIVPPEYHGRVLVRENHEGVNVLRCWLYATPNRGVLRRSVCFLSFMVSALFFGAFFSGPCDVVVATSPQMLCGLAGYLVSLLKWKPFVLEVRDLWPKQIIDLGVVKNPWLIRALTALEMFLYRRAKAIVTVAPATTEEIAARGIVSDKLFTITNGIDESFFTLRDRHTPVRAEFGWGEDIVVMYIGTHGMSQGLGTILETARLLEGRGDIRFVFVGTGAERDALVAQAQTMGLTRVSFLPMQPKARMPEFYGAADICVVPLRRLDVFLYNIPSKMFEIMACGRPMVLGVQGQAQRLLEASGSGIAVEPENAPAFAEAITRLADAPALREQYGIAGRTHVVAHYSRTRNADDYLICLDRVVSS